METQQLVEKGQRRRGPDTGRIYMVCDVYEYAADAHNIRYEDNGRPGSIFDDSIRAHELIPDVDWRNVLEGQAGDPIVCLKCGGEKRGQVFTCEPCGKLEGTPEVVLKWQHMITGQRMSTYGRNREQQAKWRAEREAEDAVMIAAGFCMNCMRMPTVPPGMTVAVKDERGHCWACHLDREKHIASDMSDPESDTPSALMPIENPLVLEAYDNRVAGIGAFGRIWRMR